MKEDLKLSSIMVGSSDTTINAIDREDVIIIIDVLRCSSSIIVALAKGVIGVLPVSTVKDAIEIKKNNPHFILAGERKGIAPQGFDYGNSPAAFLEAKLTGTHLILTTTNGTASIYHAREAEHILIGAFLNAEIVAETAYKLATKKGRGITLVLSGRHGSFSLEDFLGAGAIAEYFPEDSSVSDATQAAILAFRQGKRNLCHTIKQGSHARYLIELGLEKDVNICSQVNRYPIIPYLNEERVITLLNHKKFKKLEDHI